MKAPEKRTSRLRPRHGLAYEWAIVTAAVILITFVLVAGSWTWKADQVLYDFGISLHSRPIRDDIVIVAIDDASIADVGPWPWRRSKVAGMLASIAKSNPKSVGVDLPLSEPDLKNLGDDKILAEQLQRMPYAVLAVLPFQGRVLPPVPAFAKFTRLAGLTMSLDPDGVLRRVALEQRFKNGYEAHMAQAMAELGGAKMRSPHSADYLIPFLGPQGTVPQLSAAAILRGEIQSSQLAEKFVLVGVTAEGLADTYTTPSTKDGRQMPAIEVTANILSGLLDGN